MTDEIAMRHAFWLTLAILVASCTTAVQPTPLGHATLKIENHGIAVPPSVNHARVEPDGTVVLEYTP